MKWVENIILRLIDYGFSFWFSWVNLGWKSVTDSLSLRVNITFSFLGYLCLPFGFARKLMRIMGAQISKNEDNKSGSYVYLGDEHLVVNEQKNKYFDLDFNGNFKSRSHIHFGSRKKIKDSDIIAISWESAEKRIDGSLLRGLEKGSKVFWVKANIAEAGSIKWIGRIRGILFAGLQLENKVSVTLEGYSGKSLFTCKSRRGRALVLLSQVVPDKEFLCRDETRARNVAAVDFEGSGTGSVHSQRLPSPKSIKSEDRVSTGSSVAENAYLQYNELKPQSWDIGDRIYFPAKKRYATIIARGWTNNRQEIVIEYDECIGDRDLIPTDDVWFKEGHGRVISLRKLVANAFIVEPNLNTPKSKSSTEVKKRHSAPPECNNNEPSKSLASSVTTVIINPRTEPHARKRHSEQIFSTDKEMRKKATFSSLEYPPEITNGRRHERTSVVPPCSLDCSVAEKIAYDNDTFWGECPLQNDLPALQEPSEIHSTSVVKGRRKYFQHDVSENKPNFLRNTSLKRQSPYWGEGHYASQRTILKECDNFKSQPHGLSPKSFSVIVGNPSECLPKSGIYVSPSQYKYSEVSDPGECQNFEGGSVRSLELIV